jgi:hypothetical protein
VQITTEAQANNQKMHSMHLDKHAENPNISTRNGLLRRSASRNDENAKLETQLESLRAQRSNPFLEPESPSRNENKKPETQLESSRAQRGNPFLEPESPSRNENKKPETQLESSRAQRGDPSSKIASARPRKERIEPNTADEASKGGLQKNLPKLGYAVSVAGHLSAAFAQFSNILPESLTNGLNHLAPNITKLVNSINFFAKGADAFKHNRALDSIARMLFPVIVPFMPVEDMYLGAGLGLGLTMMNDAHESRVKDKSNLVTNFKESYRAFKELVTETWQAGLGKDRKILVSKDKEKGHSMHSSGIGMLAGSALGLINKYVIRKIAGEDSFMANAIHKFSATFRNVFGIWGDIIIMLHPDENNIKAGRAYIMAAALDTLQAVVLPKELREGVSHIVQSLANVANYFYANTSQARSDGEFVDYA